MSEQEDSQWAETFGELRSALHGAAWRRAVGCTWMLRELDEGRYLQEVAPYVEEQLRRRGAEMLETEQRREAVRQWARAFLEGDETGGVRLYVLGRLIDGDSWSGALFNAGQTTFGDPQGFIPDDEFDDWARDVGLPLEAPACLAFDRENRGHQQLRQDMRDLLWSAIEQVGCSVN